MSEQIEADELGITAEELLAASASWLDTQLRICPPGTLMYPSLSWDSPSCYGESWGTVHVKPSCRCPKGRR
jgi:hypothetical protein